MRPLFTMASIGLGVLAIGSASAGFDVEQREEFSITKKGGERGVLEVENANGAVTVTGVSNGSEIRITGERVARGGSKEEARANLDRIEVKVVETELGLVVRTVVPDDLRSHGVTYKIELPRGWDVRVSNGNGNVSIGGVRKSASATVGNGGVQIDDVVGDVHVNVGNGGIRSNVQVPANGTCRIKTSNGAINAKLVVESSASCDLKTTNGAISLSLPNSTSAGVSASTSVGSISVQGLEFANRTGDRSMSGGSTFSGTLGSGSGTVNVATTTGAIALKGF